MPSALVWTMYFLSHRNSTDAREILASVGSVTTPWTVAGRDCSCAGFDRERCVPQYSGRQIVAISIAATSVSLLDRFKLSAPLGVQGYHTPESSQPPDRPAAPKENDSRSAPAC